MELTSNHFPDSIVQWFSDARSAATSTREAIENIMLAWRKEDLEQASFPWILGQSGLPWLPLKLDFPFQKMAEEARALRDRFVSHRSGVKDGGYVNGNRGWAALALHGISPTHTMSFNVYRYPSEEDTPYQWTEIADLCPVTTRFFKETYPCDRYYRVRYTIIEPGGFIYPHTDRKKSALWEVNLALQNPDGFHFKMDGAGYVPFSNGRAFILDVSKEHAIVNHSDQDRIHMIVHGNPMRHPKFQKMILESFLDALKNPESLWNPHA